MNKSMSFFHSAMLGTLGALQCLASSCLATTKPRLFSSSFARGTSMSLGIPRRTYLESSGNYTHCMALSSDNTRLQYSCRAKQVHRLGEGNGSNVCKQSPKRQVLWIAVQPIVFWIHAISISPNSFYGVNTLWDPQRLQIQIKKNRNYFIF